MHRTVRPPEPAWLDVHAVAARYSLKAPTVWLWARTRREGFPQPVRLTPGCSRWRLADLERWESERQAQSGTSRREFDERRRRDAQRALKRVSATNSSDRYEGTGKEATNGHAD